MVVHDEVAQTIGAEQQYVVVRERMFGYVGKDCFFGAYRASYDVSVGCMLGFIRTNFSGID